MFGMSLTEMMIIAVIGLVVFGPKRIPAIARGVGKAMREMRRAAAEVQYSLDVEDVRRDLAARNAEHPTTTSSPPKAEPPKVHPEPLEDDAVDVESANAPIPVQDDPIEDAELAEPVERPSDLPDTDDDDAIAAALAKYAAAPTLLGGVVAAAGNLDEAVVILEVALPPPAAPRPDAIQVIPLKQRGFQGLLSVRSHALPAKLPAGRLW